MNNKINEIYVRFNNILSGCNTILDAFHFSTKFIESYPEYKDLIHSMIQSKNFENNSDMRTLHSTILALDELNFREDVEEYINKLPKNSFDNTQLKAINRILLKKKNKITDEEKGGIYKINADFKKELDYLFLTKQCPHCERECSVTEKTDYIICGYQNTKSGFDWFGCGKDWCFECGKMLCKSWSGNNLCSEYNRFHDDKCCKAHAQKNGFKYPEQYCQCITKYVRR